MKILNQTILRCPKLTVIIITAVTIFLGYQLRYLSMDNDVMTLLPDDDPTKLAQKVIEDDFGATDMVLIGLSTDTIYKAQFLTKVKEMSDTLKNLRIESDPYKDPETGEVRTKKKKCIEKVTSLSTTSHIEGDEEGMTVATLMKRVPTTGAEMDQLRKKISSWDFYTNNLVSGDGTATIIAAEYKATLSPDELIRSTDAIIQTVEGTQFDGKVQVFIAGEPFARAVITKNMMRDNRLMMPAVFAVVVLFLYFVMRRISSVVLIFLTIAISVVWTIGLMPLFGLTMNLTTSAVPVLLVAIGSAYSIHIVSHYMEERAEGKSAAEAVKRSISIVGVSVLGAALTTVAGFMSLMTSKIVPIYQFGLFTGIGTAVAFLISVIFVPALLLTFDGLFKHQKRFVKSGIDLYPFLSSLSKVAIKRYKLVLTALILVCVVAGVSSLKLYPDLYVIKNFKKDSKVRIADTFLCEKFGGTTTTVLELNSGKADYFKNPAVLQKLDDLSVYLKKDPQIGAVISIAEPIKRMNYSMNGNDEKFNAIPKTKEQVAQYLVLNSDPESLDKMVTPDFSKASVMILQKDGSTAIMKKVNERILAWLDREMPDMKVLIGGTTQMGLAVNDLIVKGQIRSLIFSILSVLVIASFILKSFVGGFLAVIPLTICVILNFGILGLTGIPLDAGTALISSIAIGIAVDYSIHLINGIQYGMFLNDIRYGGMTKDYDASIDKGIKITGNAIVFNAVSVALGFLVLTFSSFTNLIKLGGFIAFTMVTSCIATIVLIPVLVHLIKPKYFKKG